MNFVKLEQLLKRQVCLNCEQGKWKNPDIQVCQSCYTKCTRQKCIHCKEEFSNHKFCIDAHKSFNKVVCLKCLNFIRNSGAEPMLCRFCACWSAWNGRQECQRCEKSLAKFGMPKNCERCGKNSAFDRGPESRSKVGDLFLCYLCTFEYKKNEYYKNKLLGNSNASSDNSKRQKTEEPTVDIADYNSLKEQLKAKDKEIEILRSELSTLELRYKSETDALKSEISAVNDHLRQVVNDFNHYKETKSSEHIKLIREKQDYIDDLNIAFSELRQKHESVLLANTQLAKTIESLQETPRKVSK